MAASSLIQCKIEVLPQERYPTLKVPRSLAVVRVEPSFTSSDLFTPFCAPRATLPSIAKFVRPSYGKDNTWGQLTSSYGGVGPAADNFRKTNHGSVSRSHRHYGTGCVNCHTLEPTYSELQLLTPNDFEPDELQLPPKPLDDNTPTVIPDLEPAQTTAEFVSSGTVNLAGNSQVPVAPTTVHALESLYTRLYGVSTYKKDFASANQSNTLSPESTVCPCASSESAITCSCNCRANFTESSKPVQECPFVNEDKEECPCVNEDEDADCEEEPESGDSMESDKSLLTDDEVLLPHHIAISHLCHLPVHFRRITTKYTRNKCATIPCNIPYYLYYKHCLLPSSITSLPANCFSLREPTWSNSHHRNTTIHHGHEITSTLPATIPPQAQHGNEKLLVQNGDNLPDLSKRVPHGHLKPLAHQHHQHKPTVQQLGLRFRSQAHARFCSRYPNQVPDLRQTEKCSSRRHTFFGHHATVFRG